LAELDEIGDVALHHDVVGSVSVMLETADGQVVFGLNDQTTTLVDTDDLGGGDDAQQPVDLPSMNHMLCL
jgi:hypothetical protein